MLKDIGGQFLKTDGGKTQSKPTDPPSISLPKGGGALKGIDEKFSVNAVNGTSSFSVPLPSSPARGLSPSLGLSYNSGTGNGIFGLGWSLNLSSIKRKTDKELPRYLDAPDTDTFLLSEAEDLVPEFLKNEDGSFKMDSNGGYIVNERDSANGFIIRNYKPRTEGTFARIERWTEKKNGRIKWRIISKENITTLFGWTGNSVLSNPEEPIKIYQWLPEFVFDDKGNCMQYVYRKEDESGLDELLLSNRNRLKAGKITYANIYLDKILYGNKYTYSQFGNPFPDEADYNFQTVFDYGTLQSDDTFEKVNNWDYRADSFSDYKAGFEIRTTRLCKRVLLYHVFNELAQKQDKSDNKTLVKSVNFEYDETSEQDFTFLKKVTSYGYIKKEDGTYSGKRVPPIEFGYQKHDWNSEVKTLAAQSLVHAPAGCDGQQYQLTDLFNEGLPGILTEQANGWYYKENLGNASFAPARQVSPKPSFIGLDSIFHFADLNADGGKQLVQYNGEQPGFFELGDDNQWQAFRTFETMPDIDFRDANTRMLDLDGDGRPEVVISEDNVFTWYASAGREGFAAAMKTVKPFDEEQGPNIVFADAQQSIYLADMSGDGMADILRIRNAEVCYWPNLGYGRFGAKVAMDNAPVFDHPDAFNPNYLRLSDIDGSGTSDIIYLGKGKFTCWKNLSGNSFSTVPFEIDVFPQIQNQASITVSDLFGNGVPCLIWSSPLPDDAKAPLKYIDLMNGRKPHLINFYKNNLGKEVALQYCPSTRFYLEDKLSGKPWATKLHFPVHCVAKTITEDKISGYKFISEYKYHHGYYDHAEREFRGFGMVEQIDAQTFEHWKKSGASNVTQENLHEEPVVSRTWYHTGAFLQGETILNQFAGDYWYAEMERQGFNVTHPEVTWADATPVTALGKDVSVAGTLLPQEWREAIRTCKGMTLRSEVFARDAVKYGNTDEARKKELTPFTVATKNYRIELVQPKGQNKHAIFTVKESEAITYSYERNTEDPRIAHNLNIKSDEYGNMLESATVVYPRLFADDSLPQPTQLEQNKTVITYTLNKFTNDVIGPDTYRLRLPSETKMFELKGVVKAKSYYSPADFTDILLDANSKPLFYHEIDKPLVVGKAQKRLIEHTRSTYYGNNLSDALPLHCLESLALTFERYQLAYTPELLTDIFATKVDPSILTEGKFVHTADENGNDDLNWWTRSGTTQYITDAETDADARNRFYIPVSYTDPYNAVTRIMHDDYFIFIKQTENALGNTAVIEEFNFRTLSPKRIRDMNGNLSEAVVDELGLVKAVAIMGKGHQADELTNFSEITDPTEITLIDNFFQSANAVDLNVKGKKLLGPATSRFVYDFENYLTSGKPAVAVTIIREQHFKKLADSPVQITFEYSNGIGEIVMKKVQAEPGVAKKIVVGADDHLTVTEVDTALTNPKQLRWIGNGRTVKNNKGHAVMQYEPYFSINWQYEAHKELVETGVSPVMHYDAAGRLIRTDMPEGTFSKIEFGAWKQKVYDANDTVLESEWYLKRTDQTRADFITDVKEQQAAMKALIHHDTPSQLHFDTLGRPVLQVQNNGKDAQGNDVWYKTKVERDTEGNLRKVIDAREIIENGYLGNVIVQYKYDMLGNLVYQNSMDAGQRWLLIDVVGKPLRTWDERNHEFQYHYDSLHRPTFTRVTGGDGTIPLNHVFDRVIYGEGLLTGVREGTARFNEGDLQAKNVLGQVIRHYDTAGLVEVPEYDFKGLPLATTRKLFKKYKETANWEDANLVNDLEAGDGFTFSTDTDALGRIVRQTVPDGSIILPSYNQAGLLDVEMVLHAGAVNASTYIKNICYNEKRQREKIIYGNDVSIKFDYDKDTFRLARYVARRLNNDLLGDLYYTYDPVGNITHIEDKNIPVAFFSNQRITGISTYTYDALYRLTEASGRENNVAIKFGACDNWNDAPNMLGLNPSDPIAMRNYTQRYRYDAVGNITEMKHLAVGGSWTRGYEYETSGNRLKKTFIGDVNSPLNYTRYGHHAKHGFIQELPNLEKIAWNFKEEVVLTASQRCTDDNIPETTYYQYDGNGQRIRKITEKQTTSATGPLKKQERIYIAGYETYRTYQENELDFERDTLSLLDNGQRFVMIDTVLKNIDVSPAAWNRTGARQQRYQLCNHLGSATLELDDNAALISYEEYHPYGTTAYQAYNNEIKVAAKRYRYTGMERDQESGLSYHSARYYLPWLGRWLSSDPISLSGGINTYAYSNSNPVLYADKSGLQADEFVDSGLQALIRDVNDARADLMSKAVPTTPAGPATLYNVARRQASTGQRAFRVANGMRGSVVQAGHVMQVEASVATNLPRAVRDNPFTMMALHSRIDPRFRVQSTSNAGTSVKSLPGQAEVSATVPWENTNTRHTAQEALIQDAASRPMAGPITQAEARGAQVSGGQEVLWRTENTPWDQRNAEAVIAGGYSDEASRIESSVAVQAYRKAKAGSGLMSKLKVAGGVAGAGLGMAGDIADAADSDNPLYVTLKVGTAATQGTGGVLYAAGAAAAVPEAAAAGGYLVAAGGAVSFAVGSVALAVNETKSALNNEETAIHKAVKMFDGLRMSGERQGGITGGLKQAGGTIGLGGTYVLDFLQGNGMYGNYRY